MEIRAWQRQFGLEIRREILKCGSPAAWGLVGTPAIVLPAGWRPEAGTPRPSIPSVSLPGVLSPPGVVLSDGIFVGFCRLIIAGVHVGCIQPIIFIASTIH